jgi:hypothetical protein
MAYGIFELPSPLILIEKRPKTYSKKGAKTKPVGRYVGR